MNQEKYLLEEIKHDKIITKNTCKNWNYIENLLILASTFTGCVLNSAFPSLVVVPLGVSSSAVESKICVINAWIKKDKSIIKKKTWKNSICIQKLVK